MKSDDREVLWAIQKNAQMGMKAIDTLSDKVYDDKFALQMARDGLKYSDINDRAKEAMLDEKQEPYKSSRLQDMMLTASIHGNTLLNTSTSHIADMLIQGNSRGLSQLWKALNRNPEAGEKSLSLAKELMDFEESNTKELKRYL